jgi:hypothetical protein
LPGTADAIERWLNVVAPKTAAISTDISNIVSGGTSGGSTAADKPTGPTGIQAWLAKADQEAQVAQKRLQLIGAGLPAAVAESITSGSDAVIAADEALRYLASNAAGYIAHFTDLFNRSAEGQRLLADAAAKNAKEAAEAAEQSRQKEQEILDKRQAAYESFSNSVKGVFGSIKDSIMSAFTLPDLGNSVNSITRNIKKLIERTRSFAANITSLSQQGLGNELLQQIIAAGPMQGGKLAAALAGAGSGTISQLNQAFGEFGGIASGIAGVGAQSAFSGQQTVNNYNIEVTGGLATGSDVGRAVVNAIKDYERQSGAAWRA